MKFFAPLYVIVAGLAALFIIQPVTLVYALLFSFGFGFPLVFVPSAALYLTALWPAVLAKWRGFSWPRALAIAAAGVLAVALLPGMAARMLAGHDAAAVLSKDVLGRLASPPRAIEFEQVRRGDVVRVDSLRLAPCDALCQNLLLAREVDAIRISSLLLKRAPDVHIVYTYEERPDCPRAFADAKTALKTTQHAASHGRCIIASIGAEWAPGTKILISETREGWRSTILLLHTAGDLTRYEVLVFEAGAWQLRARTTELRTKVLRTPLLFGFPDSYGFNLRPGWERTLITYNNSDRTSVARASLGYRAEPGAEPPAELPIETITRILSRPGSEPFGPELMVPIDKHLKQMRTQKTLSPEDIKLLEILVADKRVTDHRELSLIMSRHPEAGAGMIKSILERLEVPTPEERGHNQAIMAWILARAPIGSLIPHAERILAVANSSGDWHIAPVLRVLGRIGVDPTELLRIRLRNRSHNVREQAAYAVCVADEIWGRELAPDLLAVLEAYRKRSLGGNSDIVWALKGLKRWGRGSEADQFEAQLSGMDARHVEYRMKSTPACEDV